MNKKGFLLGEETLKIIVAVIAIGFLIYFLTSLYFANADQDKIVKADAVLEKVSNIIDNPGINSEIISAVNPSNWHIYSFLAPADLPNSCLNQNCICICNNKWISSQATGCDEKGACLIVSNLDGFDEIKIKKGGLTSIEVNKQPKVSIIEK